MIRHIERSEIPSCVKVIKESFATVAKEFNITVENAPRYVAFATSEKQLYWQFDNGRPMFVYINDSGKIIGYFSLDIKENNECELNNLCVLPDFRHKNIGENLLNYAFSLAIELKCNKMYLSIVEENVQLRKWYTLHGFSYTESKKFDFFPFTCGYMTKNLT